MSLNEGIGYEVLFRFPSVIRETDKGGVYVHVPKDLASVWHLTAGTHVEMAVMKVYGKPQGVKK
jgi:hypothetical protein